MIKIGKKNAVLYFKRIHVDLCLLMSYFTVHANFAKIQQRFLKKVAYRIAVQKNRRLIIPT